MSGCHDIYPQLLIVHGQIQDFKKEVGHFYIAPPPPPPSLSLLLMKFCGGGWCGLTYC